MKTLLTIIFLNIVLYVNGQYISDAVLQAKGIYRQQWDEMAAKKDHDFIIELFNKYYNQSQLGNDTSMCVERGHVINGAVMTTDMYCPGYVIDYPDSTVYVNPNCNTKTYYCKRCGKQITEGGKPTREVIWRRPNHNYFDCNE
jgi:hypothetical protein